MIDLHAHVLAGLDDGPETVEQSLAILRAAAADGVEIVAATPHVRSDYPTTPALMESALAELRAAEPPVEVLGGGEVALDRLASLSVEDRMAFGLGGNPAYLLLEFPYSGWPLDLADRAFQLAVEGVTPVLAHPERNGEVQAYPSRLASVIEAGALVQLTASSLDGRLGRRAMRTALALLDAGHAHMIASDAHAPGVREAGLRAAADAAGGGALADWLTAGVPGAVVRGEPLPPRPVGPARRRWWARGGGRA